MSGAFARWVVKFGGRPCTFFEEEGTLGSKGSFRKVSSES